MTIETTIADPAPVSVGDDHRTHAWTKWRPVSGGLIAPSTEQQRNCVICNFAERIPIAVLRGVR